MTRRSWIRVAVGLLLALVAALPAAGPAGAATPRVPDDPALRSAPADRLDRLATALRSSPVAVDPELDWLVDGSMRRRLLDAVSGSSVPILVVVLPLETEDESGGDAERVLRGLQQRLREDAMYVVIDDRGTFESSPLGIARTIDVPFELRYPPIERRAEDERRPDPFATVPGRLSRLARIVDRSPRSSTPTRGVTAVRRLSTLPSEYAFGDEDDGGLPTAVSAVLLALLGGLAGLGIVRVRARRAAAREREAARAARARARAQRAAAGKRGRRRRRRRRQR
ncbi:hypothetical protein SK069_10965 [Patulibacter brassicae]|uniref:TPM domain-containing protein n=1 Tax=Patulibacter brassicae TaxID=1705717 RepID=A0ABU4VME4_9ACTN|nr:hypothetical protein [Patulibacter brassicae]MDX8152116.1 hypothetical protein [Patulibacter brassicae]